MQIISEKELKKHGTTWSLSRQAVALVNQQKSVWPLAGANYRSLRAVETKTFHFGLFRVECHFNPGRIRSSAANTSEEAIRSRPCFLCRDNLPAERAHELGLVNVLAEPGHALEAAIELAERINRGQA